MNIGPNLYSYQMLIKSGCECAERFVPRTVTILHKSMKKQGRTADVSVG